VGSNPIADMAFAPEGRGRPGGLPNSCRKVENDPPNAYPRAQRGRRTRNCRGTGSRGATAKRAELSIRSERRFLAIAVAESKPMASAPSTDRL
jgi:hypothetical protein